MKHIVPCLWFNKDAEKAAEWYVSIFPNSQMGMTVTYPDVGKEFHGMDAGSVMTVEYTLAGVPMMGLNGGPHVSMNPSLSFFVDCAVEDDIRRMWNQLAEGGTALMELASYPFSQLYGWITDKFGVSWQFNLVQEKDIRQMITPTLLFCGDQAGKAEQAIQFYTSLFESSRIDTVARYGDDEDPNTEGSIKYSRFMLNDQQFGALDSFLPHSFGFSEALSLLINCDTQEEIDFFWDGLAKDGGEHGPCGWLKDRFGFSWQVAPSEMSEFFSQSDKEKVNEAFSKMMKMQKIIISELR